MVVASTGFVSAVLSSRHQHKRPLSYREDRFWHVARTMTPCASLRPRADRLIYSHVIACVCAYGCVSKALRMGRRRGACQEIVPAEKKEEAKKARERTEQRRRDPKQRREAWVPVVVVHKTHDQAGSRLLERSKMARHKTQLKTAQEAMVHQHTIQERMRVLKQ